MDAADDALAGVDDVLRGAPPTSVALGRDRAIPCAVRRPPGRRRSSPRRAAARAWPAIRSMTSRGSSIAGDVAADLGQRRHLVGPPMRFLRQAGVLEGDAEADGERRDQPQVAVARSAPSRSRFWMRDHADRVVAVDERRPQRRLRLLALDDRRLAGRDRPRRCVLVDEQRFAGLEDVAAEPDDGHRRLGEADAALDRVREADASASGSRMPMSTTWASKISMTVSPTRSYIAWMSSRRARPSWTPLTMASSAARSSASVSRRGSRPSTGRSRGRRSGLPPAS